MKIKLRKTWASAAGNFPADSIVTVKDDVGKHLIDSRQAELVDESFREPAIEAKKEVKPEIEVAMIETPETEATPQGRHRRHKE